jgi:hypothetical protein
MYPSSQAEAYQEVKPFTRGASAFKNSLQFINISTLLIILLNKW